MGLPSSVLCNVISPLPFPQGLLCSALLCSGASHLSHFRMCDCGGLASPGWFPFPPTLLPSLRPLLLSPDPAFISVLETASPSTWGA